MRRRLTMRGAPGRLRRLAVRSGAIDGAGGEREPNTAFGTTLLVVLVIHLVAVGGIFAFTVLKEDGGPRPAADARPAAEAAASAQEPGMRQTGERRIHYVQQGETLSGLAVRYGVTTDDLAEANGLRASAQLVAGQELRIPLKVSSQTAPLDVQTAAATSRAATRETGDRLPGAPGEEIPAIKTYTSGSGTPAPAQVAATPTNGNQAKTGDGIARDAAGGRQETAPGATAKAAREEELRRQFRESRGIGGEKPAASPSAEAVPDTYTVQKGDNPVTIARRFNVSYRRLLELNDIRDPRLLQIGKKLKLPPRSDSGEKARHP